MFGWEGILDGQAKIGEFLLCCKSSSFMTDEGESCKDLPEELVEKILAMLPYPHIFKAMALSKSWLARFFPAEAQDTPEDQLIARRFQTMAGEWSSNWEVYCLVHLGQWNCCAYTWASHSWRRIPSLSFVPNDLLQTSPSWKVHVLDMLGALVLFVRLPGGKERKRGRTDELYVANIFTRAWKSLPPHPHAGETKFNYAYVVRHHTSLLVMFKIITCEKFSQDQLDGVALQIYDSNTKTWSSMKLLTAKNFQFLSRAVHLDGILYMVADRNRPLAINFEVGTLEELGFEDETSEDLEFMRNSYVDLIVCNSGLLMIATGHAGGSWDHVIKVLRVDMRSRRFIVIARSPHGALALPLPRPVSHGDSILFDVEKRGGRVLTYSVVEDEWSWFPAPVLNPYPTSFPFSTRGGTLSFQPGLNPFAVV